VFSTIEIHSAYTGADGRVKRSFNFRLSKDEQIVTCDPPRLVCPVPNGTRITLRDYKGGYFPEAPGTLIKRAAFRERLVCPP
jgi:hypothetical protein